MLGIPGLDHIIDAVVYSSKWVLRFGRSKKILIVGQGRAGKTSLFRYMRRKVIHACSSSIPITRVADKDTMFPLKEKTTAGDINVEVRLARDLAGQTYPNQQANWFLSDKPHILFVFLRFDLSLEEDENDINNVRYWLEEFFSEISNRPRALSKLVRITFVVSHFDQSSTLSTESGESGQAAIDRRCEKFREVVKLAYEKLPSRKRQAVETETYFLQMCYCDKVDKLAVKLELDRMLVESFVAV